MLDLQQIHFIDLLPPSLSADPSVQAIAAALDPELQSLIAAIPGVSIWGNLPDVPERVLDLLADELQVDSYSQSYSIAQKQALIAIAVIVHRHKGTAKAIRDVVTAIFGTGMTLQEWHQYGGAPYHYRLIGSAGFSGTAQQDAWIAAVQATKNARSVLDGILVTIEERFNLHTGYVLHTGRRQRFIQQGA